MGGRAFGIFGRDPDCLGIFDADGRFFRFFDHVRGRFSGPGAGPVFKKGIGVRVFDDRGNVDLDRGGTIQLRQSGSKVVFPTDIFGPLSLTDKAQASGAWDGGSIPPGGAIVYCQIFI